MTARGPPLRAIGGGALDPIWLRPEGLVDRRDQLPLGGQAHRGLDLNAGEPGRLGAREEPRQVLLEAFLDLAPRRAGVAPGEAAAILKGPKLRLKTSSGKASSSPRLWTTAMLDM